MGANIQGTAATGLRKELLGDNKKGREAQTGGGAIQVDGRSTAGRVWGVEVGAKR